jgi:hypothetical protein
MRQRLPYLTLSVFEIKLLKLSRNEWAEIALCESSILEHSIALIAGWCRIFVFNQHAFDINTYRPKNEDPQHERVEREKNFVLWRPSRSSSSTRKYFSIIFKNHMKNIDVRGMREREKPKPSSRKSSSPGPKME